MMVEDNDYSQHFPKLIKDDNLALGDDIRQKLYKRSKLSRLFKSAHRPHSQRIRPNASHTNSSPSISTPALEQELLLSISLFETTTPITLDSTLLTDDIYSDHYEWAILYENQRGLTAFSTPYYSSLSLLPSDPSPYTLPNAPLARSKQPPVSLENYPLPDGNWHWVSRCWMIDMRSDSGEVQYDGFEYNWMFRRHGWRPRVGSFNAGGWVRRRRWVRLMVRPAKSHNEVTPDASRPPTLASTSRGPTPSNSILNGKPKHRKSMASSFLQSSLYSRSTGYSGQTDPWSHLYPDDVWLGDDPEADWQRCTQLMKRLGRDGRKLELWGLWFGIHHPAQEQKNKSIDSLVQDNEPRRQKQWTEDDMPMPSEVTPPEILSREKVDIVPRAYLLPVLKRHTASILQQLIYPESRAQFIKLLVYADLISEIKEQIPSLPSEIDFWSYAEGIGAILKPEAVDKPGTNTPRPRSLLSGTSSTLQATPIRLAPSEGAVANIRITPFKSLANHTSISHSPSGSHLADVD